MVFNSTSYLSHGSDYKFSNHIIRNVLLALSIEFNPANLVGYNAKIVLTIDNLCGQGFRGAYITLWLKICTIFHNIKNKSD